MLFGVLRKIDLGRPFGCFCARMGVLPFLFCARLGVFCARLGVFVPVWVFCARLGVLRLPRRS